MVNDLTKATKHQPTSMKCVALTWCAFDCFTR